MSKLNSFPPDRMAVPEADVLINEARRLRLRRWTTGLILVSFALIASGVSYAFTSNSGVPSRRANDSVGELLHASPLVVAHWIDLTAARAGLPAGAQITALTQYNGRFVAAGDYFGSGKESTTLGCPAGDCNPVVWTSTDGSHWSITFAQNARASVAGEQLVATPTGLLLFNSDEATKLWSSTNGRTWHPVGLPAGMSALGLTAAVWGHGRVVALFTNKYAGGPNHAYGESDAIWTSGNGITWHQDTVPGSLILRSLASTSSGFLVGGASRTTGNSMIWSSPDGLWWHRATFVDTRGVPDLAVNGRALVAEVISPDLANIHIWRATTGRTWTSAVIKGGPIRAPKSSMRSLFTTSTGFVVVEPAPNKMWASSTGQSWSLALAKDIPSTKFRLQRFFPNGQGGLLVVVASANLRIPSTALTTSLWRVDLTRAK